MCWKGCCWMEPMMMFLQCSGNCFVKEDFKSNAFYSSFENTSALFYTSCIKLKIKGTFSFRISKIELKHENSESLHSYCVVVNHFYYALISMQPDWLNTCNSSVPLSCVGGSLCCRWSKKERNFVHSEETNCFPQVSVNYCFKVSYTLLFI